MPPRRVRVGVDVGGTFTDLVALEEGSGVLHLLKRPTTPDDQSEGLADGLAALLGAAGAAPGDVAYLGHGTTVCINAVLEGKGARTGLVTTQGMRDLLELRRQTRGALYDLQADKPEPIVPRPLRREVPERVRADGAVLVPLDLERTRAVVDGLVAEGVEALAVCFLHAYANPAHEAAVGALVRERHPGLYLSLSSEVLPEFREFERLSTTVMNATVGPVMARYLGRLEERLRSMGVAATPFICQSNGGVATVGQVTRRPVFTMASGPSAGVAGAAWVARQAGQERIITFDMGGTSTDVCVVERGIAVTASAKEYRGHPVKGAMLDVDSVGAGGGSLAWVDPGGFLRVGPESAGAAPGPACYGRGGTVATVTDANLVLGRLDPEGFLGGTIRLDPGLAARAIERGLGPGLGLGVTDAALGVLAVVNAGMASAIRLATVERGLDPRRFTLVAYGGAGPMHATAVARSLGIPRVLVPPHPGVLCALGLLVADVRSEWSRTAIRRTDATGSAEIAALFADLEARAREWVARGGLASGRLVLERSVDMRYHRQNHELPVGAPRRAAPAALARSFHRAHRRVFGYDAPDEPTELVTFRVTARVAVDSPPVMAAPGARDAPAPGLRKVCFGRAAGFVETPVWPRAALAAGEAVVGPAIIEQADCTTVVEPGQRATADAAGNLLIDVGGT
jgi:N-methylhydantoinase A